MCSSEVLGEGGLATECLAASLDMTAIRPLARMYPSVSGERGRVAEGLPTAEPFAAMGSLTGVDSDVDCQGTSLNEALLAEVTRVRALVGMDAVVSGQVAPSAESLIEDQKCGDYAAAVTDLWATCPGTGKRTIVVELYSKLRSAVQFHHLHHRSHSDAQCSGGRELWWG